MSSIPNDRGAQLVAAGEELTAAGIPVLPIKPRAKSPIPDPKTGSWRVIADPDEVRPVFAAHPTANLALLCGRTKGSPVVVVDIDGPTGLAKARELGISSGADCWVQRTGGGWWHIVYYAEDGLELHRCIKPHGVALDLIVDGYALVEPSVTQRPYRWEPGHSPSDIPLADLVPPPAALVSWWQEVQTSTLTHRGDPPEHSRISEGQRNHTLTTLGGALRRRGLGQRAIQAALLAENVERCEPPLPDAEVVTIAKSIGRYAPGELPSKRGPVYVRFQEEG